MRSKVVAAVALTTLLGAPAMGGQTPANVWKLQEVGRFSLAGTEVSGPIRFMSLASSDRIFASTSTDPQVFAFSLTGQPIQRIGQSGSGPGEFRSIGGFGWNGDAFWVIDANSRAISVFDQHLKLLEVWGRSRDPNLGPSSRWLPMAVLGGGVLLFTELSAPRVGIDSGPSHILLSFPGGRRDTILLATTKPSVLNLHLQSGGIAKIQSPWAHAATFAVSSRGDRFVVARWSFTALTSRVSFELEGFDSTGKRVFRNSRSYQPVPLTKEKVRQWIEKLIAGGFGRAFTSEDAARRAVSADLVTPAALPPLQRILISTNGELWLRREDLPNGPQVWEVLNQSGHLRGRFITPVGLFAFVAAVNDLWGTIEDGDGMPVLVRYRLIRN